MTPHYDWTPASEPPDTNRDVLIWADDGLMHIGAYIRLSSGEFWEFFNLTGNLKATYWRDVEPPKSGAKPANEHPEWLRNVCRYISDTLAEGTPNERTVARTIMHMLPLDNGSIEVGK